MPTLYVENVPEELYEALRARAKANRASISAEVLSLLKENVPTAAELARRKRIVKRILRIRAQASKSGGRFPTAEEMLREDRSR
jgi:hypothetical protein